jgi:hypothetical protein
MTFNLWTATKSTIVMGLALVLVLVLSGLDNHSSWASEAAVNPPRAHVARKLNVTDTAHLSFEKSSGSLLLERGPAKGKLPGTVQVRFDVGPTVTATFTIYTSRGTLSGHGSGVLHSSGVYASFGGSMTITKGSGTYRNARGHGGFYGVLNRSTYALTVQTTGNLSY